MFESHLNVERTTQPLAPGRIWRHEMKNRLTKGLLASALALSLVVVACDSNNPDDGGSSTTAPADSATTTTLAG
jgi:hypothetical protein